MPQPAAKDFGKWLVTQRGPDKPKQIAKRFETAAGYEITTSAICRYEKGWRLPELSKLAPLAIAYGVAYRDMVLKVATAQNIPELAALIERNDRVQLSGTTVADEVVHVRPAIPPGLPETLEQAAAAYQDVAAEAHGWADRLIEVAATLRGQAPNSGEDPPDLGRRPGGHRGPNPRPAHPRRGKTG